MGDVAISFGAKRVCGWRDIVLHCLLLHRLHTTAQWSSSPSVWSQFQYCGKILIITFLSFSVLNTIALWIPYFGEIRLLYCKLFKFHRLNHSRSTRIKFNISISIDIMFMCKSKGAYTKRSDLWLYNSNSNQFYTRIQTTLLFFTCCGHS